MTRIMDGGDSPMQLASRNISQKQSESFTGIKFAKNMDALEKEYKEQEQTHLKLICAMVTNQTFESEMDPNALNTAMMHSMNTRQMLDMSRQIAQNNALLQENAKIERIPLLDKRVEIPTTEFHFDGSEKMEFAYKLQETCQNPAFAIYNQLDLKNPVFIQELNPQALSGKVVWNGLFENGEPVPNGNYMMKVYGQSAFRKDTKNTALPVGGETSIFLEPNVISSDGALVARKMEFAFNDIKSFQNKSTLTINTEA